MPASRLVRLLEASAGPLSPAEQESALAALAKLPAAIDPYGSMAVSTVDLGFDRPDSMAIFGIKPRELRRAIRTEVDPRSLCYSQSSVTVAGLKAYIAGRDIATGPAEERWAELPLVIQHAGRAHVASGHTRLAVQMLAGRRRVDVMALAYDGRAYHTPEL